jgi:hypothetical protein
LKAVPLRRTSRAADLFVRLAEPHHHREAITNRPLLLQAIGRQKRGHGSFTPLPKLGQPEGESRVHDGGIDIPQSALPWPHHIAGSPRSAHRIAPETIPHQPLHELGVVLVGFGIPRVPRNFMRQRLIVMVAIGKGEKLGLEFIQP